MCDKVKIATILIFTNNITMSVIRVHDKSFEIYLSEETILQRVKEIGGAINKDYAGKTTSFYCHIEWVIHVCFRSF